jgi:translation initiation factor IF-2
METRSIAIGLVAIVAAFAAAFGMAKSGGSKTETAGAGVKAQSIKLAAPAAVTGVEVGGTVPALKTVHKAPAKKKKKAANTSAPSTSNTASPSATAAPSATPTQPSSPAPSNPQPSAPKPQAPKPKPQAPAQGGGEDG